MPALGGVLWISIFVGACWGDFGDEVRNRAFQSLRHREKAVYCEAVARHCLAIASATRYQRHRLGYLHDRLFLWLPQFQCEPIFFDALLIDVAFIDKREEIKAVFSATRRMQLGEKQMLPTALPVAEYMIQLLALYHQRPQSRHNISARCRGIPFLSALISNKRRTGSTVRKLQAQMLCDYHRLTRESSSASARHRASLQMWRWKHRLAEGHFVDLLLKLAAPVLWTDIDPALEHDGIEANIESLIAFMQKSISSVPLHLSQVVHYCHSYALLDFLYQHCADLKVDRHTVALHFLQILSPTLPRILEYLHKHFPPPMLPSEISFP